MLGEMHASSHTASRVNGAIAYTSQRAWIQNASVQDNITFFDALDRSKYDAVVEASALVSDLAIMPAGDQTEIGEQGLNMSGGQKGTLINYFVGRDVVSSCKFFVRVANMLVLTCVVILVCDGICILTHHIYMCCAQLVVQYSSSLTCTRPLQTE